MKIVIASDSFKGCLSSWQVGKAIQKGVLEADPQIEVEIAGIANGGNDSLDILQHTHPQMEKVEFRTIDAWGRPIQSNYLMTRHKKALLAVIGTANTASTELATEEVEQITSFGLGTQIRDAVQKGAKRIIMLTGGVHVSDGGLGLLQALGVNFYNQAGHLIDRQHNLLTTDFTEVRNLIEVVRQFGHIEIMVATDLTTNYISLNSPMSRQLQLFQKVVATDLRMDISQRPGLGADGGIAGALVVLGGRIVSRFETLVQLTQLRAKLEDADLLILGDGKLDYHAHQENGTYQLAHLAQTLKVPAVAIGGRIDATASHFEKIGVPCFCILHGTCTTKHAMSPEYATKNITATVRNLMALMTNGRFQN